ncbi:MAG: hypothetical protein AAF206_16930 [Bacteroidota bacterium]
MNTQIERGKKYLIGIFILTIALLIAPIVSNVILKTVDQTAIQNAFRWELAVWVAVAAFMIRGKIAVRNIFVVWGIQLLISETYQVFTTPWSQVQIPQLLYILLLIAMMTIVILSPAIRAYLRHATASTIKDQEVLNEKIDHIGKQ